MRRIPTYMLARVYNEGANSNIYTHTYIYIYIYINQTVASGNDWATPLLYRFCKSGIPVHILAFPADILYIFLPSRRCIHNIICIVLTMWTRHPCMELTPYGRSTPPFPAAGVVPVCVFFSVIGAPSRFPMMAVAQATENRGRRWWRGIAKNETLINAVHIFMRS